MMSLSPRTTERVETLCRDFDAGIEANAPMSRYTSSGVGGRVPFVINAPGPEKAARLISALRDTVRDECIDV